MTDAATAADPGTTTPATAADPGAAATTTPLSDAGTAAPAAPWWENQRFTGEKRTALTAKGLTLDDPLDAIDRLTEMQINAERRLGAPPDQLLTKPKKGEDVTAWMKNHADLFGIPEAPEKYTIKRPEAWPKDAQWDEGFEAEARKLAHEEGLSGKALQRMTDLYAGTVAKLQGDAAANLQAAQTAMMADLEKDWGGQTQARIGLAQQAASVMAEKMGLDQEGMLSLMQSLKPKTGDAGIMRLFATIGEMMADDSAVGIGKGAGGLGLTPAEARAELASLRAPGGAYYEATMKQDRRALEAVKAKIDSLSRIAAG